MNSVLKIALLLTAVDKMSPAVAAAAGKSIADLERVRKINEKMNKDFLKGGMYTEAGNKLSDGMSSFIDSYKDLEDASTNLKISMMQDGGTIAKEFDAVNAKAIELGNILPGSTADFQNMFAKMINSGIDAKLLMGETGKAAAYLAVNLRLPYEEVGRGATQMQRALGVADKDMIGFLDLVNRTNKSGVEFEEMRFAMARAQSGNLKVLGIQGLEQAKKLGTLFAMMIRGGASGEVTGTSFATMAASMFNAKKIKEANTEAAKFGIHLQFLKDGKFAGIENLIGQLGQLKKLTPEQMSGILTPIFGPTGADAGFAKAISQMGISGFNELTREMYSKASLQDQINERLGTFSSILEAMNGNVENMKAALQGPFMADLKNITHLLGRMASGVREFATNHPKVFRFIGIMTGLAIVALHVAAAIKVVTGAWRLLGLVAMASPLGILLIGLAVIATAIYVYWDNIKAVFVTSWNNLVSFFNSGWELFSNNWKKILVGLVFPVAGVGMLIVLAIKKWFPNFYNAGYNIIKSIVSGISNGASLIVDKVKNVAQQVRDFFPFSPAKTGPLRDIHRIKLMETVAMSIKANPLVNATRNAMKQTYNGITSRPQLSGASSGGGASISINYSPVINMSGDGGGVDFKNVLRQHKDELMRMIKDETEKIARLRY